MFNAMYAHRTPTAACRAAAASSCANDNSMMMLLDAAFAASILVILGRIILPVRLPVLLKSPLPWR